MSRRYVGDSGRAVKRARAGTAGATAFGQAYSPGYGPRAVSRGVSYRAGYDRKAGYYGRFSTGAENREAKYHDVYAAATAVAAGTATRYDLNIIAQGDNANERVGRKVMIKSIHFRATNWSRDTTADAGVDLMCNYRVVLVLDKQCNGASPAFTDIFDTTTITDQTLSFRRLDNSSRFKILLDRFVQHGPHTYQPGDLTIAAGTSRAIYPPQTVHYNKDCHVVVEYDNTATTGSVATTRSNNLMLFIVNGQYVADKKMACRLRYYD